jgi:mRNA interferase MazF
MEKPLKGEVVVLPFPFTNLSAAKRRPALVLANTRGDDVILCPISSQIREDLYAIPLESRDFFKGSLHMSSSIRPNVLFTADKILIEKKVGILKKSKTEKVVEEICMILKK